MSITGFPMGLEQNERFGIESASSPTYHNYLNGLVSEANIVCVSVEYRRAPEHPLPAAYKDSWAALKWVTSHSDGAGTDKWLNAFADPKRTFLAGGANITHYVALRFGTVEKLSRIVIEGAMLVYPYFWGIERLDGEMTDPEKIKLEEWMWRVACPGTTGNDDPRINPAKDPELGKLGCSRVAVFVARVSRSGWGGKAVVVVDSKGVGHVFHLDKMKNMVDFINAKKL